jgi:hypothetical protein
MKKVLFAFLLFALAFALPVTVYTLVSNNFDTREEAAETEDEIDRSEEDSSAPSIVSMPVTDAQSGEKYSYVIKGTDPDNDNLTYYIRRKPDWLNWNSELKMLEGTPTEDDVGSHFVELSVSDGKWLDEQKFNIEVVESVVSNDDGNTLDEGDALGAQASRGVDGQNGNLGSDVSGENSYMSDNTINSGANGSSNDISQNTDGSPPNGYGLISESADDGNESGDVLGDSDERLPETAIPKTFLIISGAFAILCVSLFFYLDAKYSLLEVFSKRRSYKKGGQIVIETENGGIIKKRQMEI